MIISTNKDKVIECTAFYAGLGRTQILQCILKNSVGIVAEIFSLLAVKDI
jgi:hypothetical protein